MKFLEESYWNQFNLRDNNRISDLINYYKKILSLGDRKLEVFDRHHMVPKSFNVPECRLRCSIIILTPREHYEVHKILTECFIGDCHKKMTYAFHFMTHCNRDYSLSDEDYEYERKNFSNTLSSNMRGSGNPFYGKKHTRESIRKASESHSGGKFINNGEYELYVKDEEDLNYYISIGYTLGRSKSSISGRICINKDGVHKYISTEDKDDYLSKGWNLGYTRGRVDNVTSKITGRKLSQSHKDNISKSITGDKNPFYGKKHTEESRRKMSESTKGQIVWQKNILIVSDSFTGVKKARDICNDYSITYSDIKEYIDTDINIKDIKLYSVRK